MSDRRRPQRPLAYAALVLVAAACLVGGVAGVVALGHAREHVAPTSAVQR